MQGCVNLTECAGQILDPLRQWFHVNQQECILWNVAHWYLNHVQSTYRARFDCVFASRDFFISCTCVLSKYMEPALSEKWAMVNWWHVAGHGCLFLLHLVITIINRFQHSALTENNTCWFPTAQTLTVLTHSPVQGFIHQAQMELLMTQSYHINNLFHTFSFKFPVCTSWMCNLLCFKFYTENNWPCFFLSERTLGHARMWLGQPPCWAQLITC